MDTEKIIFRRKTNSFILKGIPASPGKVSGKIRTLLLRNKNLASQEPCFLAILENKK